MTDGGPRVDFRDMTEADLADGLRLSRASGWNQTLADWRMLLSLGPGLFRVAVQEGRVVASGGAARYGDALAWICMILVDPGCRGHGLGTRIFDEVLARCEDETRTGRLRCVGLDATPAGRGIYLQRGFVERVASGVEGPFGGGPGVVRMRAEPAAQGAPPVGARQLAGPDLEAVLGRDREVFGADRGPVLRWAHDAAPDLAWVAPNGGYCLGRHGDHSDHVGPVVAEDREDALALVRACLARPGRRPLILDARVDPAWRAALGALGFREQRPFTRMYLGVARPAARPSQEAAVFGPEFG